MKCSLGISNFLEEISSLSYSIVFLHFFAWITEEGQRNQRSNCQHLLDHWKSKRVPEKNICFCFIDYTKTSNCVDQNKLENSLFFFLRKFLNRWEYQTTWPASWEICMQVKKQQLELDMKQQTGSKLGKKYVKDVYCHPAHVKCQAGWSTSWNQDCREKYQ